MLRPARALLTVGLSCLVACSSGSSGTGSGDGLGGPDGGGATNEDGGGSGGVTLNGCTTFDDETAPSAARKMVWDLTIASSPKRCMMIAKGQTVAFEGDFGLHPLVASGGDTPTPFASVPATGKVTFTAAGLFGFVCGVHPSMTGAIKVAE